MIKGGSIATLIERSVILLYAQMPKEIKEYEGKILFGLSLRQALFLGLTIIVCIGSNFLLTRFMDSETASWFVMFLSAPLLACGFVKKNGMTCVQYCRIVYAYNFRNQKLKYDCEPPAEKGESKREAIKRKKAEKGLKENLV